MDAFHRNAFPFGNYHVQRHGRFRMDKVELDEILPLKSPIEVGRRGWEGRGRRDGWAGREADGRNVRAVVRRLAWDLRRQTPEDDVVGGRRSMEAVQRVVDTLSLVAIEFKSNRRGEQANILSNAPHGGRIFLITCRMSNLEA